MKRPRRCVHEARSTAEEIFRASGWTVNALETSGKHPVLVVTDPSGDVIRFPICNSPSHGDKGAVNLAKWNARKLVRQTA